jgi:hypothetical protein
MKKKYISPSCITFKVKTISVIAASIPYSLDPNADGNQYITPTEEEVNEFTSRRHNVWEDEDEDF